MNFIKLIKSKKSLTRILYMLFAATMIFITLLAVFQ